MDDFWFETAKALSLGRRVEVKPVSWDRCEYCRELVNTDDSPDCYVTVGTDSRGRPDEICVCGQCAEFRFRWCEAGTHWVGPQDMSETPDLCANCEVAHADEGHGD